MTAVPNVLHSEIRSFLLGAIRDGELSKGDLISDQYAARALGVSRTPVRSVLEGLEKEGVVSRHQGRGWRVAREPRRTGRKALDESIFGRILNDRIKNKLGAEVFESELMARYDCSRASTKRALERLATDGLVERRRGHGWRFTDALSSAEALSESYVFREILECGALAHQDWRDLEDERQSLIKEHKSILERLHFDLGPTEWFETNRRFHEYIASGLNNGFVRRAIAQQNRLRRIWEYAVFSELSPESIRRSCEEHLAIMKAIEAGDRTLAAALLRHHLRQAAK